MKNWLEYNKTKRGVKMGRQRMCDVVSVKISPTVRTEVEKVARRRETGLSEVVRNYLMDGLRRDGIIL